MKHTKMAAAERFAQATAQLDAGDLLAAFATDLVWLLEAAVRLKQEAADGMPDPLFVDDLREQLRALSLTGQRAEVVPARWGTLDTPLGRLGIVYRQGLVLYCSRFVGEAAFVRGASAALGESLAEEEALPEKLATGLLRHLEGRGRFEALDISWLPPFQRRVLEKTAEIPRGEVRPYAWIAREIGAPGAARAVGTALARNPIPFIIPCHRVVRADGALGEYSGGGPEAKRRVLAFEQAPIDALLSAARTGTRLAGSRTTHLVCYPSCRAARRIRPENVRTFRSLAEAEAGGYRPCMLCRPA